MADFIEALLMHAKVRHGTRFNPQSGWVSVDSAALADAVTNKFYWVCAYGTLILPPDLPSPCCTSSPVILVFPCASANNQHMLGEDISTNPKESAFFRAMEQCVGILLVLDKYATPFTRVWW